MSALTLVSCAPASEHGLKVVDFDIGDQVVAELLAAVDRLEVGRKFDDRPILLETGERLVGMLVALIQSFKKRMVSTSNWLLLQRPVRIVLVSLSLCDGLSFLGCRPGAEVSLVAVLLRVPRIDIPKVKGRNSTGLELSLPLFEVP